MDYRLQDLIDVPMFQALLDRLNDVYAFPSAIIDREGNVLTATAWQDVCTKFHRAHPVASSACAASDREILAEIAEGNCAVTRRCPHGLSDSAVPIVVAGRHLANFFTGQLFLSPPDLDWFRRQAADFGFDEAAYLEAVSRVPVWPQEKLDRHLSFIKGLAEVIQRLAERTLRQREIDTELGASRESLALALRSSEMGVWRINLDTNLRRFDELVCRCLGLDPAAFGGTAEEFYQVVHADDRARIGAALQQTIASGTPYQVEYRVVWPDGSLHHIAARARLSRDDAGRPQAVSGVLWDVTDRKRAEAERASLESQLQHAQKLESVGRLAGGVAHDFNNMLSVILGNSDMLLRQIDEGHPLYDELTEIRAAAERAASTTRQLLAFARRQTIDPRVVDLNEVVTGTVKVLARLIGEDISLHWQPAENLWPVKIDASQVDQLLANLCVNARDAIVGVGHVTVETANVVLDEKYCAEHAGFVPGEYVRLAVSDSGCGIDPGALPLVFDPFFTTKPLGEGTGLGLATVYGIVRQNNGFVNVYSELGQGTRFSIYLPRADGEIDPNRRLDEMDLTEGGAETILLVEDEASILKMTARILRRLGYEVLEASAPGEAIQLARGRDVGRIQLLLTDVVMPEMNGRELAAKVSEIHPGIRCLFTSGYTANVIAHRGVLDEGVMFIEKPFSPDRLAAKVREALAGD